MVWQSKLEMGDDEGRRVVIRKQWNSDRTRIYAECEQRACRESFRADGR